MQSNAVGWFEIPVLDMDRAKSFYQHVFQRGEFIDLSGPEIAMFAFPGTPRGINASGALVRSSAHHPSMSGVLIYFSCVDCALEASRTAEKGGVILRDKFSVGQFGFVAVIQDTEGNMIGLHSNR
jgi:predicted enzyme related to lactoylglutathione lyase